MRGYFLFKIMSLSILLCSSAVSLHGMINRNTKLILHKKHYTKHRPVVEECCLKALLGMRYNLNTKLITNQEANRTLINHIPLDCLMHIYNYGGFKVINLLQKTNKEWHEKLSQLNNDGDSFVKRMYPLVANQFWNRILDKNRYNILYRNLWYTDQDVAKKFDIKNFNYNANSDLLIQYSYHRFKYTKNPSFEKIRQVRAICRDNNLLSKEPLSSLKVYLHIAAFCEDTDTIKIIAEILAKTDDFGESKDPIQKDRIIEENYEIHNNILRKAMNENNEKIFRIIATIDPLHVKNRCYKYIHGRYDEKYSYRTFFDYLENLQWEMLIYKDDAKKYRALYKECGGKTVYEIHRDQGTCYSWNYCENCSRVS